MDRSNWSYYNADHYDHYYNQSYQQDGQHTFPPGTGQTSGGMPASGTSGSLPAPGQPYLSPNLQTQIPTWPSSDWEYLLRTPQPITMEDTILPLPQAGQTSAGIEANGPSWTYPASGQPQPYHDINTPAQIPSWPRSDWENPQPITWEDISQNDERPEPSNPEPSNPQPPAKKHRNTSAQVEESFLAGLDHYAQGGQLKDCSTNIKGRELCNRLSEEDKDRVDRALLSRRAFCLNRVKTNAPVEEQHYYNQSYQQDGQHSFPPGTGQTSGGMPASEASGSLPAPGQPQPYHDINTPAQIPSWPRSDWENPQPITWEDISQNDERPEPSNPEPSDKKKRRNTSAQVEESFLAGLDHYAQGGQLKEEDKDRVDRALLSRRAFCLNRAITDAPVEESFLAGLAHYARGAPLTNCSSTISFRHYVSSDGYLTPVGQVVYDNLSEEDQTRVNQALLSRREIPSRPVKERVKDKDPVAERFLASLENYAGGVSLRKCSRDIRLEAYLTDDGRLRPGQGAGEFVYDNLGQNDKDRVDQALLSRRTMYLKRVIDNAPVEERFLASLDNYAEGVAIVNCSKDLFINRFVTDDGRLREGPGESLYKRLSQDEQARVKEALLSRRTKYLQRVMKQDSVEERFLASLDNYGKGIGIIRCSKDVALNNYVTDDGRLQPGPGESLYNRLSQDDKMRVDQALIARRRRFTQRISGDVKQFVKMLEPYGNGLTLEACGLQSGLRKKANTYLTPEGGLTHKGILLIQHLQPDEQIDVWLAIERRQKCLDPSAQVSGSTWQLSEMPSSMPEPGGMNQAEMVDPMQMEAMYDPIQMDAMYDPMQMDPMYDPMQMDPMYDPIQMDPMYGTMQTEAMYDPMQMEAMWASAWQLTGQAVPGIRGMSAESAEPPIPHYGSDVVGADFQHRYNSNGLMPQSAPDRLIGRGIEDRMLINILGEEYRVHYTGSSGNPTNENPYGKKFMLVPRLRGG
ncbi:MAG: hypothetical protein P8X89_01720 [Reinekea sp.]